LTSDTDKAAEGDKKTAHKIFQEVAFAYAVLSDDRRRKRYDLTGSTAESLEDEDDDFNWLEFYREQFENAVNEEAINRISNEYKNSEEERRDLIKAYIKVKGHLDKIYQLVMLSDILEDDDRFRQILEEEIEKGTIDSYTLFARETDATRQKAKDREIKRREDYDKHHAKKEAAGETPGKAKAKSRKGGGDDMASLAALIQQRQKARAGNFFDQLESKYAPKSRGSKRSTPMEEPPEDAFQANAARKKHKQSNGCRKKAKDESEGEEMDFDEEDIGDSDEEQDAPPPKSRGKPKSAPKPKTRGRGRVSNVA